MRWVQKIREGGDIPRYFSFVVREVVPAGLESSSVSEAEAARLVSTGDWRYVDDRSTSAA